MLTDTKIRAAKPQATPYRMADAGGLFLYVSPAGGKSWRLRYRLHGREQTMVIGPYPGIGIAEARSMREQVKGELARGNNPKATPPDSNATTLASVSKRWHDTNLERWTTGHANTIWTSLTNQIFGFCPPGEGPLGERQIAAITSPQIMTALRVLEGRDSRELAHRLRNRLEAVFAFAMAEGLCTTNPAAMIAKALKPITNRGHRPAVTCIEKARSVLRQTEDYPAYPVTRLAMRLLALTALRPGELLGGRWGELSQDTWVIPAERMKMKIEHGVPLVPQMKEALMALHSFAGFGDLMFPSIYSQQQPVSVASLSVHLRLAGLQGVHVPHGWRATFATVMNERYPLDPAIDLCLAHKPPNDPNKGAYNRMSLFPRRRELVQEWATLLMQDMPPASELILLPKKTQHAS